MPDWYWAARDSGPAADAFVIEEGQERLWQRVRREISESEHCSWMPVHWGKPDAEIDDILRMLLTTVPMYRVNHNRFVYEAAKIPVFARFIHDAHESVVNFVSNSAFPDALIRLESYSNDAARKLALIVTDTLGVDDDWYEI